MQTGVYYGMFDESSAALICALPARFRTLAEKYSCAFVDGSAVTAAKCSDQIHLTAEEHAVLGRLIADQAARAALTPCPKAFVIFLPGFVT